MLKRLLVALLLVSSAAHAEGVGPKDNCYDPDATTPAIDGLALTASRTFTFTQPNSTTASGAYRLMEVYVTLVDADTSITSLTMTCTGSRDDNATDFTPKTCVDSGGTTTCSSTGVWPFSSPGSSSWHFPVDIRGVQDVECTWAVAAGAAAAGDLISVWRRLCEQ